MEASERWVYCRVINIRTSYKLLQVESLLTVMMLTVPVLTLFLNSIGLDQTAVGVSQALFMAVAMLFDVPSGWIADRYSRKLANCLGDILVAVGLFHYARTYDFSGVLISEMFIGIGMAFTNGADVGLLKSYAKVLKKDYAKLSARLGTLRPIAEMLAFAVGGFVATYNMRATFVISGVIFIVGAILSLLVTEIGERRKTEKHPIRDMADITYYSLHKDRSLKWRIVAFAIAQNATHTVVWLFTPMLIAAGFAVSSLGVVWATTLIVASLGSLLAHRYAERLNTRQRVALPLLVVVCSYFILGSGVSAITIGFSWLFALSRGWYIATLHPMVQDHTPADIQATVISVASLARRFVYIPLVMLVNLLASYSLELALLGSGLLYLFFALILWRTLGKNSEPSYINEKLNPA